MREGEASETVSHPMILWAAWLRVDRWYRTGNLAPQPELARWRLHPEAELRRLGRELKDNAWKPTSWPQVPYPKKGASLRHYVMPSVKDQVAFMAYLVLLAPLLDRRAQSFVFGNRWYRPMYWNRRCSPPRWELQRYPLLTTSLYRSYAQSFGLFRRVAHWTVARMTDTAVLDQDYGGPVRAPSDYSSDMLPQWTTEEWWKSPSRQACWVALDLQLAYPSVKLSVLRESMIRLLDAETHDASTFDLDSVHGQAGSGLRNLVSGYPGPVLDALDDRATRRHLANRLGTALEQVHIDSGPIALCTWRSRHAQPLLPPDKDYGLPTGLAVSGILLNVVLSWADDHTYDYLKSKQKQDPGAIVRFADDVYLMSTTYDGLFALVEQFWHALSRNDTPSLVSPSSRTNLHLGLTKIRPDAVQQVVHIFLKDNQWTPCNEGVKCGELTPPRESGDLTTTISKWWRQNKNSNDKPIAKLRPALDRAIVLRNDLGPFVTALVERLSDIGNDTLADRFGAAATNRLERLHELARFDIDDEQVRADTRRAFAANRLVRMWLPPHRAPDAIQEIRNSIAHVLQLTPWKHALWRAVVRASALRPHGQWPTVEQQDNDKRAGKWLKSQLDRVALYGDGAEPTRTAWAHTWPEACVDVAHDRQGNWRDLYLSYHRTMFWHELSSTLVQLWRHVHADSQSDYVGPSPYWWTTRAIPDGNHGHVVDFLGAIDKWIEVLYPGPLHDQHLRNWELDQLCMAVLASRPRSTVARALRSCREPSDDILRVPAGLSLDIKSAIKLLDINDRVLPAIDEDVGILRRDSLAHIALGGHDRRLGQELLGTNMRHLNDSVDSRLLVSASIHLSCVDAIEDDLLWRLTEDGKPILTDIAKDPMTLLEYHRIRRAAMGRPRRQHSHG